MEAYGPFVVRLVEVTEGSSAREMVAGEAELGLDPERARLESPVVLRTRIYRSGLGIEFQGSISTRARLSCGRCLGDVILPLEIPFRIYSEKRENRDHRPEEEVREDDVGIVYHDGQYIDLTDEVRQELLVELPWHILCSQDCKGLCPRCGNNLNEAACNCGAEAVDDRWTALRKWKEENG